MQTGVLTATGRRKLIRGGCSIESDTDYCEVNIRDGKDSVSSRSQSVSRTVRHMPVNLWHRGDQLSVVCSQRLVVEC